MRISFQLLRFPPIGAATALTAGMALVVWAQIPSQFQYQRWPDRYEGIRTGHHAAGERLELVSVIGRAGLISSPAPDRVFVGFVSNSSRNVSIAVRDLDRNYWMEPIDQNGNRFLRAKSGFNEFAWDGTEVKYIGRTAQDLYALIQCVVGDDNLVLPAILGDSASALPSDLEVKDYEFAFVPHGEADLSYEIQSSGGQTLKSDDLQDLPDGETVLVRWEPAGQGDGIYHLRGQATFHFKSSPPSHQNLGIDFYHVGRIHIGS